MPRLRTVGAVATISLMLLVLFSGVLLFVLSARGRRGLEEREAAGDRIRDAENVRVALLQFARDSDFAYLTRTRNDELKRLDSEASLLASVAGERSRSMDAEERNAFTDTEIKVRLYLVARRDAEAQGPSIREVLLASASPLDVALGAARHVVDVTSHHLGRANAAGRARKYERDVIDAIAVAVLLLAFSGALVGLRWLVIQPLLGIGEAIRDFAGGDRRARARERGLAEFQATARMFNQLVTHMVRQEEQRLTFLAGVAHDMRNPLAALRISTHLLRPGVPLPPEEKVRATMAVVERQVTRLDRMVADFLDASRIESGHLELRLAAHDICSIAEESVRLYSASSYSHELSLQSLDDEVSVSCDATRIEQVLNNLISNAIKFSPMGGPLRVTVSRKDGFALIEVADRGIGIARDDLDQIFEPFRRTGASRETIPGVGLGLWVSRRIVEAHGGTLEVSSQLGVGSTFRVRLPLSKRAGAGEAPELDASLH